MDLTDINVLNLEKEYDTFINQNDKKNILGKYSFNIGYFYKSQNNNEMSTKWFKKTLTHESNVQEKYMSCIYLYEVSKDLNYLFEASHHDPDRPEWIAFLLNYCYERGYFKLANGFYSIFKDFFENKYMKTETDFSSKLMIDLSHYNFYIPFNMIIVAWNVKDFETGLKMFKIIFSNKCVINSPSTVERLLDNLQFFIDHAKKDDKFFALFHDYLRFVHSNNLANLYNVKWIKRYVENNNCVDLSYIFPKRIVNFDESQCKDSKNILFYTGCIRDGWNLSYLKDKALGGSEKATLYLITELSKILPDGWKIYVCGGVGAEKVDNIEFIDDSGLDHLVKTTPFHTLIVSRWVSFFESHPDTSFYKSYVVAHDVFFFPEENNFYNNPKVNQILSRWDDKITNYICLTEWHKKLFQNIYPIIKNKIIINNNGINPEIFPKDKTKKKNSFVYTSRTERGLSVLLNLWPQILEKIPDATLKISSYVDFPLNYGGQIEMKQFIDSQSSITHLGKLNTSDLYDLMAESEFWLYPCIFEETSCITALEMLMSGVICLYYPSAGLTDTMSDFGIQVKPGNEIETLMSLTEEVKSSMISKGKRYAKICSWKNRAKVWENIIFHPKLI